MGMVSPNEMLQAAKDMMLEGREPVTERDWQIVMNFVACNIHEDVAESACKLMVKLYDMPLTEQDVVDIVAFQLAKKAEAK